VVAITATETGYLLRAATKAIIIKNIIIRNIIPASLAGTAAWPATFQLPP
jgi:hypothetical protein